MNVRIHGSLEEIDPLAWNRVAGPRNPFLRHEFLVALERHGCVGERLGWIAQHLAVYAGNKLVGAAPAYLKTNSYGELVFDWAWADAYHRNGIAYYPKLVIAIPYTPATGHRLLVDDRKGDGQRIAASLIEAANGLVRQQGLSSVHWLFPTDHDMHTLAATGLLRRTGCQYHWHNAGYASFDDFLEVLTSKNRKKLKRERRKVCEAGIEIRILHGGEVRADEWRAFHRLYCSTFHRRGGLATLSLEFFQEIAQTLPDNILLILAIHDGNIVASAFCMRDQDTLYGRHWGCLDKVDGLHFEACYYTGIEYCIRHGLSRFDPGAQGEHKVSRGFLPTRTWSAHGLADNRFQVAIGRYVQQEAESMEDYIRDLGEHSPYRSDHAPRPAPDPD